MNFLDMKTGINNAKDLKDRVLAHCAELDMKAMADDVQPFLFNPADAKKVLMFTDFLKQVDLK
ncbi:MAG: hypothetical protein ABI813_14930 [Bacteroidota bacterium]